MKRIRADFNNIFQIDRYQKAVYARTVPEMQLDEVVETYDSDGNTCQGTVIEVGKRISYVALDWDTWKDWTDQNDLV